MRTPSYISFRFADTTALAFHTFVALVLRFDDVLLPLSDCQNTENDTRLALTVPSCLDALTPYYSPLCAVHGSLLHGVRIVLCNSPFDLYSYRPSSSVGSDP